MRTSILLGESLQGFDLPFCLVWFLTSNKEIGEGGSEKVCGGTFPNWPHSVYGGVKEVTLLVFFTLVLLVCTVGYTSSWYAYKIRQRDTSTGKSLVWKRKAKKGGEVGEGMVVVGVGRG